MVSVIKRTRRLQQLLSIRNGPGAAVLPPEVTGIHMDFSNKIKHGHYGAKKFWKTHLVRLKYHNPAVPMTITRTDDGQAPAQMTVHFSSSPSSSASISPASETASRSEVIDMKSQSESSIMEQLIALTKARAVKVSPEDARQTQELEEYSARNAKVRELMAAAMARRKKERDILNQARGEAEALTRDE